MALMAKELVRCTLRLSGPELAQVREVQELLSLNAEVDACRYLMQRGLEAISGSLGNRRLIRKMETAYSPQELLPFAEKIFGGAPPPLMEAKTS